MVYTRESSTLLYYRSVNCLAVHCIVDQFSVLQRHGGIAKYIDFFIIIWHLQTGCCRAETMARLLQYYILRGSRGVESNYGDPNAPVVRHSTAPITPSVASLRPALSLDEEFFGLGSIKRAYEVTVGREDDTRFSVSSFVCPVFICPSHFCSCATPPP